jgi:hypothetical protein
VCTAEGECVSRCNPACGPGQSCGVDGECHGGISAGVLPAGPRDPGWARGAGTLGIATAVVITGLTAVIVIADDPDVGIPVGIVATAIGGIAIPIVASGGNSARGSGDVPGSPGLRRTGWIIYAGALADAVLLIGLGLSDVEVPAPLAGSVGVLGASSAVMFAIDARRSARQASEGGVPGWRPGVSVIRDPAGNTVATVGAGCRF